MANRFPIGRYLWIGDPTYTQWTTAQDVYVEIFSNIVFRRALLSAADDLRGKNQFVVYARHPLLKTPIILKCGMTAGELAREVREQAEEEKETEPS